MLELVNPVDDCCKLAVVAQFTAFKAYLFVLSTQIKLVDPAEAVSKGFR